MDANQNELYSLPLKIRSSLKPPMHILCIVILALLFTPVFIPIFDTEFFIVKIMSGGMSLFFLYNWLYIGVLKKGAILLNDEGITVKTAFGAKRIHWSDIALIQTYTQRSIPFIGTISKQKLNKCKDNFLSSLWASLGGQYALSIPLNTFPKANPEKLYATINFMVQSQQTENIEQTEPPYVDSESDTEKEHSTLAALFKSFLISLIIGFICGVSIYLLNYKVLSISMLGLVWVLYTYSKSCNESTDHLPAKLIFGLICSLQVLIAPLVSLLFKNKQLFDIYGTTETISSCVKYMLENPSKFMLYYILAVIFFLVGFTNGVSFKFLRRIKRMFLKKSNGYYIVRDKRYVSIYVTDYADFDENEEKILMTIEPNHCLIETQGKKINSFYIPVVFFKESGFTAYDIGKESMNDSEYYKIFFDGQSNIRTYGYECYLIANQAKQLEVIKIEVD